MGGKLRAFLSYPHEDSDQKSLFLSHFASLKRTENIEIWTPTEPRFIEDWANTNDAWVNVVEGISRTAKKIQEDMLVWDPLSVHTKFLYL